MAATASDPRFASSKVRLSQQGQDLVGLLLHATVIEASLNRLATAQIFILDGDVNRVRFGAANDPRLAPGQAVDIIVGPSDAGVTVFSGLIVRQSLRVNPQVGTLLCLELKHAAVKMSHLRRSVSHSDATDNEIAQVLAKRSGIALTGTFPRGPIHENLLQYNVSDWDFLVMRAEACAACVATLPAGIVLLQPRIVRDDAVQLQLDQDILELEGEVDARAQRAVLHTQSWDYESQTSVIGSQGEYGPVAADGEPTRAALAALMDEGEHALLHAGAHIVDELQTWADGRILRSELARVRGRVRAWGNAKLQPGDTVVIVGASDAFNGGHFVSAVRHEFSSTGWTTDLEIGMDASPYAAEFDVNDIPVAGLLSKMPGLQIGTVSKVDGDPLGQHRVLVQLKSLPEDQDGIWARVASPDAGKEHGVFFRPEIDDEVVLGFLNEDPRDAIVIGSLFNANAHRPAFETKAGYPQQGIVTAAGLRLQLDDTVEGILLHTPSGDSIRLQGKGQSNQGIVIQDQFGNRIEMGQEGIRIKSVGALSIEAATNADLKAGVNLSAEAQAKISLKGKAMGELSTSGVLDIQGSLVKIN